MSRANAENQGRRECLLPPFLISLPIGILILNCYCDKVNSFEKGRTYANPA